MKKILVPTDFSDNASKAVEYAVALASRTNTEIILLNAFAAVDGSLSPAKGVLEEYTIDLLVMTTHKRGFWDRIFNRSMTRSMAYHTIIPLLAIPAE